MNPGILAVMILLGLIPATIAQRKGQSFAGWWLFGALIFIVALPMALMEKPNPMKYRTCPWCAEKLVPIEALVCGRCQREVPPAQVPVVEPLGRVWDPPRP